MKNGTSTAKLFISYRREDSADVTGRIFDRLIDHFGPQSVFKDVDTLPLGKDFRQVIDEALNNCSALLAVIGPQWLQVVDDEGNRRIENASDYVRIEIETALNRGIDVIPLLVKGASIPKVVDLPESLRPLAFRHGIPIRSDPDFHTDMDRLIEGIRSASVFQRPKRRLRLRSLFPHKSHRLILILSLLIILGVSIFIFKFTLSSMKLITFLSGEQSFQVYTDELHLNNHFMPSGFMGDVRDIDLKHTNEEVHSGSTALKVIYEQSGDGLGWAGVVWQYPSNNWGEFPEGFDLRGNQYVTFWARGTRPSQTVYFGVGGIGRIPGTCESAPDVLYPESLCPEVRVGCELTEYWLKYAIALPADGDLQHIISGFSWFADDSVTFYLDDIFWVSNPALPPWEGALICSPVP